MISGRGIYFLFFYFLFFSSHHSRWVDFLIDLTAEHALFDVFFHFFFPIFFRVTGYYRRLERAQANTRGYQPVVSPREEIRGNTKGMGESGSLESEWSC